MRDKQALYRNTLQRAVAIMGGVHVVAYPLGLGAQAVELMANGSTYVPEWVFLAAVDIVVTHDRPEPATESRTESGAPQKRAS